MQSIWTFSIAFAFPLCLIQHTGSVYAEVQRADVFSQPAGPNLRRSPRHSGSLASRVLKKTNTLHILNTHIHILTHLNSTTTDTVLHTFLTLQSTTYLLSIHILPFPVAKQTKYTFRCCYSKHWRVCLVLIRFILIFFLLVPILQAYF